MSKNIWGKRKFKNILGSKPEPESRAPNLHFTKAPIEKWPIFFTNLTQLNVIFGRNRFGLMYFCNLVIWIRRSDPARSFWNSKINSVQQFSGGSNTESIQNPWLYSQYSNGPDHLTTTLVFSIWMPFQTSTFQPPPLYSQFRQSLSMSPVSQYFILKQQWEEKSKSTRSKALWFKKWSQAT